MEIKIYYNERTIILKETDYSDNNLYDDYEDEDYDEPFTHKCNTRMNNILDIFFANKNPDTISFEHDIVEKLLNDFKSYFKYIEAAGGLVINPENKLLIITRHDIPDLPKGKAEESETPEITALREVEEECGISDLQIVQTLEPSYHIYIHKDKKVLKKTHWFEMSYSGNETPVPQTVEGISEVKWCDKPEVKSLTDKTYRNLKTHFEWFVNKKSELLTNSSVCFYNTLIIR